MRWYRLNEDIKNKSVTVIKQGGQEYTFLSPLQLINNEVSIETRFLNNWNKIGNKANKNTWLDGETPIKEQELLSYIEDVENEYDRWLNLKTINVKNGDGIVSKHLLYITNMKDVGGNSVSKIYTTTFVNKLEDELKKIIENNNQNHDAMIDANRHVINYALDRIDYISRAANDNRTTIELVIQELKDSNIVNYVGEYQQGTTYKLGQVVSFQNNLYLVKVEATTNEPTNTNDYDLLTSPEMDLSDYYNKLQVNQLLQPLENKNNQQDNSINEIKTRIETLLPKSEFEPYKERLHFKSDSTNFYAPNKITELSLGDDGKVYTTTGNEWKELAFKEELGNYFTKEEQNNLINPINSQIANLQNENRTQQAEIENLKQNGGGGNVDTSNLLTKPEFATYFEKDSSGRIRLTNDLDCNDLYVFNVKEPNSDLDAANKHYVDNSILKSSITSPNPSVIEFPTKACLIFQIPTANINQNDFINNMPSEISGFRKIANIESAHWNILNQDGDILTKPLDLLISHYNGRLFIKNYAGSFANDIKFIRFKIWVNKK